MAALVALERRHLAAARFFRSWTLPRGSADSVGGMVRLPSRFDPEVSFAVERAAVEGWPAEEVEEVEGWTLRRTVGVGRRRSNSLLPPPDSGHAVRTLELALATAEQLDFASVVQVSPAEVHLRLDEALEDRGMTFGGRTLVLVGEIASRPSRRSYAAGAGPVALGALDRDWADAWAAVAGPDGVEETAELVLSQLDGRARFARVDVDGAPAATAIGVRHGGWFGVFSLAVAPEARRLGLATAVMDGLEQWAADEGATRTYLQVEADNEAALSLYARRGMAVAHSYHYRSA
jgi:ribosomal protein S18 acetylase RimI-like enzyme